MILLIIGIYFLVLLGIGIFGRTFLTKSGEDYFLANRSIGPIVLLMTLFGTQMTAFAILGASGEAYRRGVGVFALMASSSAIVVPAVFFFLGRPVCSLGRRHGFMTQAEFFRARWESGFLGFLLFLVLLGLLIPYLLLGVMGAGITLNQITSGSLPVWMGSLLVCLVVLFYVTASGLRGTAWANTFQTIVFGTLGVFSSLYISSKLGGFSVVLAKLGESQPSLLNIATNFGGVEIASYLFIPMSAAMFPHLFMHWLSARSSRTFNLAIVCYPICITIVWIPTVLLGVMGRVPFPDLQGGAVNSVLVRMIQQPAPEVLGGVLAAGVFAAIMSSLDSQVLSIGKMFTQDVVGHYIRRDVLSDKSQLMVGRVFVILILGVTFGLSLISDKSIFSLGVWSFTGYAALMPILVAALYWRRSTKWGALSSLLVTAILWGFFFFQGWRIPDYSLAGGLMPVVVIFGASCFALIVGSLLTTPPDKEVIRRFFSDEEAFSEE